MKSIEAVKTLHSWDTKGRYLFRSRELGLLFNEDGNTLRQTIKRLLADEVIVRVARDVYLYAFRHSSRSLVGDIAVFMRPGDYTYESLESAASQWGIISQVPLGRISCVTTGKGGEVHTPFGIVDYEHTDAPVNKLAGETIDRAPDSILPVATKDRTISDLLEFDRSTELIDWNEVDDED